MGDGSVSDNPFSMALARALSLIPVKSRRIGAKMVAL
jgi:hypothetical protein